MTSPYAPKGEPRRSSEIRDPLTEIRERLRRLGATVDEVGEWTGTATWAELDDEQQESIAELRTASDDEIRFQIEAIRGGDEYDDEDLEQAGEGEVTQGVDHIDPAVAAAASEALDDPTVGHGDEVPAAEQVDGQMSQAPAAEPVEPAEDAEPAVELRAGLLDEKVPEILAEVGDDPRKAAAVLELESLTDRPRKTLVEPLREIIDEAATDAAG